jgi:hypothetical protein
MAVVDQMIFLVLHRLVGAKTQRRSAFEIKVVRTVGE